MSPTTIGILGHTGRVGSQITKNLIKYHTQGLVKLVILHRPGSRISDLPSEIETRVIELEKDEPENHFDAIKDLNVVMSVISMEALHLQNPLLDALAKSESLQAFTLAEIGSPFGEDDMKDPKLGFYTRTMSRVESLGLKDKCGMITSGEYMDYLLGYNLCGSNLKENKLQLYKEALTKRFPLVTAPYLGAAMAQLTLTDPTKWAGKAIHIYDYAPTGQELVDAFTSVHGGTPTNVSWYTEQDLINKSNEGDFGALEAMLIRHWGDGFLENAHQVVSASGGWREVPKGVEVKSLEEVVGSYL